MCSDTALSQFVASYLQQVGARDLFYPSRSRRGLSKIHDTIGFLVCDIYSFNTRFHSKFLFVLPVQQSHKFGAKHKTCPQNTKLGQNEKKKRNWPAELDLETLGIFFWMRSSLIWKKIILCIFPWSKKFISGLWQVPSQLWIYNLII